jgi:chromosome segregation ATPase
MAARMDFSNLAIRLNARENENEALKAQVKLLCRLLGETRQANTKFVQEINDLRTKLESFPTDMQKEGPTCISLGQNACRTYSSPSQKAITPPS